MPADGHGIGHDLRQPLLYFVDADIFPIGRDNKILVSGSGVPMVGITLSPKWFDTT